MVASWAVMELRHTDLGDARRNQRLMQLVTDLANKPSQSVPQACGNWSTTKAAYRLWDNPEVSAQAIRQAHYASTLERVNAQQLILAIQDTTELNYTSHRATTGMGHLDNKHCRGLKVHSVLAVSGAGVPLGLLHQKVWARDLEQMGQSTTCRQRTTDQKESQRWLDGLTAIAQQVNTPVIMVADREADIYELFALPRPEGVHLLIRGCHNRKLEAEAGYLLEAVAATEVQGKWTVTLKANPERPERQATLSLRYRPVSMEPPRHALKRSTKSPVTLWALSALEENPPVGQSPIHWLLLSTLPIHKVEDAQQMVRWYQQRWLIERYHYVLKSGCGVEKLQLETAERLEKALATYCIVAWRLLWLTYAARQEPLSSCVGVLQTHEWEALYCTIHKTAIPPAQPPPLEQVVRWLARLGGFLGRKGDGVPGVKVLWRGLMRLTDLAELWQLLRPSNTSQVVGNG
jgi:hypothetical protein